MSPDQRASVASQTQVRKLYGAAWSMRSWDEIIIARKIATGEVADQRLETRAADREAVTVHEFSESARPALPKTWSNYGFGRKR